MNKRRRFKAKRRRALLRKMFPAVPTSNAVQWLKRQLSQSIVINVLPSMWWSTAAVIVTSCGHSHIRPRTIAPRVGDEFDCPFEHSRT